MLSRGARLQRVAGVGLGHGRWLSSAAPFDKILVANRGEITCRIIRTARRLGVKTVAVFSEADAQAMHVRMADESVYVGPPPSAESYLRADRIIQACKDTGAQAVHPGYGFLSEASSFREALEAEGIAFLGPGSHAIEAMGDKIGSKKIAEEAGVHTIPGFVGEVEQDEDVLRVAGEIGYPVMIKASAGGGGKGMRIAHNEKEALDAFTLSKREAKASFGDDRMLVEKFVEEPRHIEIQIIADTHGNVVALPERECSVQRRNQKVLEESPSVFLDPETRQAMQEQAVMLAKAVDYVSAGTVEFLADKHRKFYFLEMNTRLQVEHPVTEYVTGLDLVEQMLRVAAGEPLPEEVLSQCSDGGAYMAPIRGWAHEARVYAEDPFRSFLPSTGRLSRYEEPSEEDLVVHDDASLSASSNPLLSSALRCDAGVGKGSEISMFYDPMICKLITHGPTRETALENMRHALDSYVIQGVNHNIPFLREVCDHPRFVEGRLTTNFIAEEYPDGFKGVHLGEQGRQTLAVTSTVLHAISSMRRAGLTPRTTGATTPPVLFNPVVVSFRGGLAPGEGEEESEEEGAEAWVGWIEAMEESPEGGVDVSVAVARENHDLSPADTPSPTFRTTLRDVFWQPGDALFQADQEIDVFDEEDGGDDGEGDGEEEVDGEDDGRFPTVQVLGEGPGGFDLMVGGARRHVAVLSPRHHSLARLMPEAKTVDLSDVVVAPMPGKLEQVLVKPGDAVEEGQAVASLVAMKMENVLRAPRKGVVKAVPLQAGETVVVDDIIIEFETEE